jgi:hypothetical protein
VLAFLCDDDRCIDQAQNDEGHDPLPGFLAVGDEVSVRLDIECELPAADHLQYCAQNLSAGALQLHGR